MKKNKFYIMAIAATGKSTFAKANQHFLGYRVVDFASLLPERTLYTRTFLYLSRFLPVIRRHIMNRPDMTDRYQENYFKSAFQFMRDSEEPLVLLGRRTPDDFLALGVHDEVLFSIVLLPEEKHRRNCEMRKKEMRNPFPKFHHWTTDFEKVSRIRLSMQEYARRHGIDVYDSFSDAISTMHASQESVDSPD